MWPFRSRTQKKLDDLQDLVNARRRVVGAALEIFERASDEFERLEPAFTEEEREAFILAQGQYGFFTHALLDEIVRVEDGIQLIRAAAELSGRAEPIETAAELIQLEERLVRAEETCRDLGAACQRMARATGLDAPTA